VGGKYNVFNEAIRAVVARESPWRHPPERALVTMGGSDVRGTTPRAVRAFGDVAIDLDVIVGPGFTDETVAAVHAAQDDVTAAVRIHRDPDDLAELMHRADFAVTALGLTAYELLAVGTPIIGTPQAPDQQPKAATLRAEGVAIVLDTDPTVEEIEAAVTELIADEELRRRLRQQGRTLVSVDGVDRFIDELERLVG
jgi:spore coat polysaccharide biosynthesis predicted glycosyltransferase SpsG